MTQTTHNDEAIVEIEKILKQVEIEYGMSGLSDGLCGDYAKVVAIRYNHFRLKQARADQDRTTKADILKYIQGYPHHCAACEEKTSNLSHTLCCKLKTDLRTYITTQNNNTV